MKYIRTSIMGQIKKIKNTIIWPTIICCVYLLLTIFYHHINKNLSGFLYVILTLLIPITFLTIIIYGIKGIIKNFRNRQNLNLKNSLQTVICLLTILYTFLSPYRLDSENLESKVDFRACYEGTQNQAYILFRKDKTFELHWTGVFGYNEWWTGRWEKKGNILMLKYDDKTAEQLGNTVVIANGYLNPIGKSVDKIKYAKPMFYLGDCKHEN